MNQILKNVILDSTDGGYLLGNIHIEKGIIQKIESAKISACEINQDKFYVTCGFVNAHLHPNQLFDRRMLDELPITALLSAMHTKQKKTDDDRYFQAIFVLLDALKSGATSMYAIASNPAPVIKAFKALDLTGAITCVFNNVWEGVGNSPKQENLVDIEEMFLGFYQNSTDAIKIHIGTASILTASNDLLILFNDIAKRYNTKVNLHISEGTE